MFSTLPVTIKQLQARKTSKIILDPEPGFVGGMPLFGSNAEVDKYFKQSTLHPFCIMFLFLHKSKVMRQQTTPWSSSMAALGYIPAPSQCGRNLRGFFFSTAVNARSPRAHTPTCFPAAQFQLLPFQSYPLQLPPPSWFCPSIWTPSQLLCFSFLVAAYCLTLR